MTDEQVENIVRNAKISFADSVVLLQIHEDEPFLDKETEEFHLKNLVISMDFLVKHKHAQNKT